MAIPHGVGLTKQEFAKFSQEPANKSYIYNGNEWFVLAISLTLEETTKVREPTFPTNPFKCAFIKRKAIPIGDCTGRKVIATTTTKKGIIIVAKQIGKCHDEHDQDGEELCFHGKTGRSQVCYAKPAHAANNQHGCH